MDTPFQFQVVSTMPEHEQRFQAWRTLSRSIRQQSGMFSQFQSGHAMQQQHGASSMHSSYYGMGSGSRYMQQQPPAQSGTKGSYNAFHGSGIANWHSILRTGL
jgi:hypothetical protein